MNLSGLVHHTFLRGLEVFDGKKHPLGATGQMLLGRYAPCGLRAASK